MLHVFMDAHTWTETHTYVNAQAHTAECKGDEQFS